MCWSYQCPEDGGRVEAQYYLYRCWQYPLCARRQHVIQSHLLLRRAHTHGRHADELQRIPSNKKREDQGRLPRYRSSTILRIPAAAAVVWSANPKQRRLDFASLSLLTRCVMNRERVESSLSQPDHLIFGRSISLGKWGCYHGEPESSRAATNCRMEAGGAVSRPGAGAERGGFFGTVVRAQISFLAHT